MDDDDYDRNNDPCEVDDSQPVRCKWCRGTGNDGEGSNYYPCPDCDGRGWTGGDDEDEDNNNEESEEADE